MPLVTGIDVPTCTMVAPGGNGPRTVTTVPALVASGDDPCITPVPTEPFGVENTNGVVGFIGARALLRISR